MLQCLFYLLFLTCFLHFLLNVYVCVCGLPGHSFARQRNFSKMKCENLWSFVAAFNFVVVVVGGADGIVTVVVFNIVRCAEKIGSDSEIWQFNMV